MAKLIGRGFPYQLQTGETSVAAIVSNPRISTGKRGSQITLRGAVFGSGTGDAKISVIGLSGIQSTGPNGTITQADVDNFTDWDALDMSSVSGHTAILDEDAAFEVIRVTELAAGNTVTIF